MIPETLALSDNKDPRQSYFGRRSSRNSQHAMSASAAEVEQACVVEEQPTKTSASRRIKRLQKPVEKSVAPVSSYLWQSDVRNAEVSGMRDGRVSQRAVIKIVSCRPGSQSPDGRWRDVRFNKQHLARETDCVMRRK